MTAGCRGAAVLSTGMLLAVVLAVGSLARAQSPFTVVAGGVSPQATAENSQRKLLVDGSGRLFLVYARPVVRDPDLRAGADQVYLAESADGGRTWRHTRVTRDPEAARVASLAVAGDALHVVWTEYAPIGQVYWRIRRGGRWTEPVALSARGVYAGIPVVAVLGGRAHVLWYGILPERPSVRTRHGSIYEIVFTRQEGARWTSPVSISPGIPDSLNPALDLDTGGRLHAAWWQFDGRAYQVRYTRYDGQWSPPRALTGGTAEHTNVALDVDGRDVHLVWIERRAARRIMYSTQAGPARAISAPGDVQDPVIAAAGGRVASAWREGGTIVVRSVRPAGPARRVGAGSGEPAIALFHQTAYVAWTATTGTHSEVRVAAVPLP